MRKNNFMNKIIKLKGSILAGIISGVIAVLYSAFFFPQITVGSFIRRLIVTSCA